MKDFKPISTPVVNEISDSNAAKPEEGAEERGLATQSHGGKLYFDYSKVWGMLNGLYYKFMAIIGGRGIGKTYGIWEYILRQYRERGRWNNACRFMWLRTTDSAVQKLKENAGQKICPYPSLQEQFQVKVYSVGSNIYIRDMKGYEGPTHHRAEDPQIGRAHV